MWGRRRGVDLIQTAEMDAFFDRLDRLNEAQLLGLRAAWTAIDRSVHQQAWAAVRAVGTAEGLTGEIDRVRNKAVGWAERGSNLSVYTLSDDKTWREIKLEAVEAIVDAALAVALGSRLGEDVREALLGPWLRVTGA
ncbi:MAG TPA: hypothetical protein VIK06_07500 [Candidatus Limnocylindrales bacterium]|jgi:hypothetical protein